MPSIYFKDQAPREDVVTGLPAASVVALSILTSHRTCIFAAEEEKNYSENPTIQPPKCFGPIKETISR